MTQPATALAATRSKRQAMWRGLLGRCPACNEGRVFARYLKVADQCETCGLELSGHQADDAPPYFTIFIVGHIIIPVVLIVERAYQPSLFVHAGIFCVLSVIVTLISLPMVKGAVVGLQWALRMHGFSETDPVHVETRER